MKTPLALLFILFFVVCSNAATDSLKKKYYWSAGLELGRSPFDFKTLYSQRNIWEYYSNDQSGMQRVVLLPGVFAECRKGLFALDAGFSYTSMDFKETSAFHSVLQGEPSYNTMNRELKQKQWTASVALKRMMMAGSFRFTAGIRVKCFRWTEGELTEENLNTRYYEGSSQIHYDNTNRNIYTMPAGFAAGAGPTGEVRYMAGKHFMFALACDFLYIVRSQKSSMQMDYHYRFVSYNPNGSVFNQASEYRDYAMESDVPGFMLTQVLPTLKVSWLFTDHDGRFCKPAVKK